MPYNEDALYKLLRDLSETTKIPWKNNALRHSFISYRVAETGDVNRTALESGNSAAVIFSNYRELVTPREAKKWFTIKPASNYCKRNPAATALANRPKPESRNASVTSAISIGLRRSGLSEPYFSIDSS